MTRTRTTHLQELDQVQVVRLRHATREVDGTQRVRRQPRSAIWGRWVAVAAAVDLEAPGNRHAMRRLRRGRGGQELQITLQHGDQRPDRRPWAAAVRAECRRLTTSGMAKTHDWT